VDLMDCLSNLSCLDIRIETAIDKRLRSRPPSRFLCWRVCARRRRWDVGVLSRSRKGWGREEVLQRKGGSMVKWVRWCCLRYKEVELRKFHYCLP
jgi:hypothetical protein